MTDEKLWVEKYRPKTVTECILPGRLKELFQKSVNSRYVQNMILAGTPGVGKTTIAKAMCNEIGCNSLFLNSSKERGIDTMRTKVVGFASTVSLMDNLTKVVIFDEADKITPDAQDSLRGIVEEFASNCSFIFTCNHSSRIIDALHSRCAIVDFTLHNNEKPKMAAQFFKRLSAILTSEGVKYDDAVLAKLIERFFPDFRRTINELQRFSLMGDINASVLVQVSDIRDLNKLVDYLKDKDFTEMRKWAVQNSDISPQDMFRGLYDSMSMFLKPDSVPEAVVIIAKYQYQSAFVADQEVNIVAMLTEIMASCDFK